RSAPPPHSSPRSCRSVLLQSRGQVHLRLVRVPPRQRRLELRQRRGLLRLPPLRRGVHRPRRRCASVSHPDLRPGRRQPSAARRAGPPPPPPAPPTPPPPPPRPTRSPPRSRFSSRAASERPSGSLVRITLTLCQATAAQSPLPH